MKKLVLSIATLLAMTCAGYAQRDNLWAHNNSNDENGCAYTFTPIVRFCTLPLPPITLTGLQRTIAPGDDYTFTSIDLVNALGIGYQYIGVQVESYTGAKIKVCLTCPYDEDYTQPDGDCQGQGLDVVYYNYYQSTTAEAYTMDEQ